MAREHRILQSRYRRRCIPPGRRTLKSVFLKFSKNFANMAAHKQPARLDATTGSSSRSRPGVVSRDAGSGLTGEVDCGVVLGAGSVPGACAQRPGLVLQHLGPHHALLSHCLQHCGLQTQSFKFYFPRYKPSRAERKRNNEREGKCCACLAQMCHSRSRDT